MSKTKISYINLSINTSPQRKQDYSEFYLTRMHNPENKIRSSTPSSAKRFFRSVKLINSKKIEQNLNYRLLPNISISTTKSNLIQLSSPKSSYSKRLPQFNQTFLYSEILLNKTRISYKTNNKMTLL